MKPQVKNPGKLFMRLMSYVFRTYKWHYLSVIALIFVSVLASVQGTMFTQRLIDDYISVGATFVPEGLTPEDIKKFRYEDYRRHQGNRHPRTAVALTDDNHLLLIVVDGRWDFASGMSARELTLFLAKHFNPRWALNLDGGGSSCMLINGKQTIKPSDGAQRSVGSTIMIK